MILTQYTRGCSPSILLWWVWSKLAELFRDTFKDKSSQSITKTVKSDVRFAMICRNNARDWPTSVKTTRRPTRTWCPIILGIDNAVALPIESSGKTRLDEIETGASHDVQDLTLNECDHDCVEFLQFFSFCTYMNSVSALYHGCHIYNKSYQGRKWFLGTFQVDSYLSLNLLLSQWVCLWFHNSIYL